MTSSQQVKADLQKANNQKRPRLPVGEGEVWGGQELKRAAGAAASWLERNAEAVNALNVFPVPDGDTGTNMALTMQAAVKSVEASPSHSAAEIASGISHGALMGARGNSGVILSQIWRGFAEGIAGKESISPTDFAAGLVAATATAYRAVLKPVEGTILTVVRETAHGAQQAASQSNSFGHVLTEASAAASASVARTPLLLEKHREAGVVDAGGQGLFVILDGMRRYAEGEEIETGELAASPVKGGLQPTEMPSVHVEHGEYGYCTNFLLVGGAWDFDKVRERIAALGDSAVIVGDDRVVKVHIHTERPGTVIDYATSLGSLREISIANMQDQHEDFLVMHGHAGSAPAVFVPPERERDEEPGAAPQTEIAVLVVASGQGLVKAFKSMGATAIVEGGQTMNPSTQDLLKAVDSVPQNDVILLPNNSNIVMAARQTMGLTTKNVAVVPTESIPQGMAALIALNYSASFEENITGMREASSMVETGEITRAVRDAKVNGIEVKNGQVIGLHNNSLVSKGENVEEVAWDLLERMGAGEREIITVYWGGDLTEDEAQTFRDQVQERYSNAEVELVHGGQPLYDYIISAE